MDDFFVPFHSNSEINSGGAKNTLLQGLNKIINECFSDEVECIFRQADKPRCKEPSERGWKRLNSYLIEQKFSSLLFVQVHFLHSNLLP